KEVKYDPFGNRIEKSVDPDGDGEEAPTLQRFALDGWNPAKGPPIGNENWDVIADTDGDRSLKTRYVRGDAVDQLFARLDKDGATLSPFWYLTDHLGSIREVITDSGVDSITYDAFGNITSDAASRGRYGWTGREYDAEIELQYNRARYYDASTGRW